MTTLRGIYLIGLVLLSAAGLSKLFRPHDTSRALRQAGLPAHPVTVRAFAALEAALACSALLFSLRALAATIAASYLAFAAFVAWALAKDLPLSSCGCFGEPDSPPSWLHVALDLVFASVSAYEGLLPHPFRGDLVVRMGFSGVVFAAFVVAGAYLSYLAMAELPRLAALAATVRR